MAASVDLGIIDVVIDGATVQVSSAILAMASPVFARMLGSGMKEGADRRVELPGKSKAEFEEFLRFLHPATARAAEVNESNVDFLVEWFNEYEIDSMQSECEAFLLALPCTVDRLLQAKRFCLHKQYARCLQAVGDDFERMDIERVAKVAPEVMVELIAPIKAAVARVRRDAAAEAQEKQRKMMRRVEREVASVPQRIYYDLPEQRIDLGGETVQIDEYARDLVAAALNGTLGRELLPAAGADVGARRAALLAGSPGSPPTTRWCCRRLGRAREKLH